MKLTHYISESISKENMEKLSAFISDNNIDEVIDILSKHFSSKLSEEIIKSYNAFFEKHGILNLNWGRKNGAVKQFTQLFNENTHIKLLNAIIDNDGAVSINDLPDTGNLYDYCKIKIGNENKDWSEEARTIATWTNSKSASAGPAEMLLKFMLIEGGDKGVGDVGIRRGESNGMDEMEVKAATLNGSKNGSGGHPAGQKGTIRLAWAIYMYLNKHLLGIDSSNNFADKCQYFQNENGIKDFNEKCNAAKLSTKDIAHGIVDALCFQYDFITNVDEKHNTLKSVNKLYEEAERFLKNEHTEGDGFSKSALLSLVGCIQLYLYSQLEQFKYFFCVLIDKNEENTSERNGFYILFRDCDKESTALLDFSKVVEHLYFGTLDSTRTPYGKTGKIFIKTKK